MCPIPSQGLFTLAIFVVISSAIFYFWCMWTSRWVRNVLSMCPPGLEFPWNQSTAMALKIAVERNSCLRQFWQFPRHFSNYCNKTLILFLFWILDKLETCLRISLVVFFRRKLRLIVIYAWFDQHLNSIKIALYGKKLPSLPQWSMAFCSPSTAIAAIKFEPLCIPSSKHS